MTLTVLEAARRIGRDPSTVRRWIKQGRLKATRVGTQHVIDEDDLERIAPVDQSPLPRSWHRTISGAPMPNIVAALHRSRAGH